MTSASRPEVEFSPDERDQIERAGERLAKQLAGVFGPETIERFDACPIFDGKRYENCDLASLNGASLDEVHELRDVVRARVDVLVESCTSTTVGGVR